MLLSKGANWKEKDSEGQTAMHLSTRHKSAKCLALLMKQLEPGEVDCQDKNNVSADLPRPSCSSQNLTILLLCFQPTENCSPLGSLLW